MQDTAKPVRNIPPRRYRRARNAGALPNGRDPSPGAVREPEPSTVQVTGVHPQKKRVARRAPETTRQEILDAAAYFLNRRPFRELTVPTLMSHTTVGRSAFYIHFKDIYGVVETLVATLRDQVLDYASVWGATQSSPADGLKTFVVDMVNIWLVNGPMLGAMIDAGAEHPRLERLVVEIQGIYEQAVADILRHDHQAGRIDALDFDELAAILVFGTQAYLKARLGHPGRREPLKVAAALQAFWLRTIYGNGPG